MKRKNNNRQLFFLFVRKNKSMWNIIGFETHTVYFNNYIELANARLYLKKISYQLFLVIMLKLELSMYIQLKHIDSWLRWTAAIISLWHFKYIIFENLLSYSLFLYSIHYRESKYNLHVWNQKNSVHKSLLCKYT